MLHVLFAEDEPFVRRATVRGLQRFAKVTEAYDGEHALELVRLGTIFDVLLTDVRMPRLDGIALIRELRAMNHVLGTQCCVLSGDLDRHSQTLRSLGIVAYEKPVPFPVLQQAIERLARPPTAG